MPRIRTVAELRAELAAKEEQLAALQVERGQLARRLVQVDATIAALSGDRRRARRGAAGKAPTAGRRKIPKNAKPLAGHIADVLTQAKKGMRIKDIMTAVRAAGYKTFSKGFYGLVAAAVGRDAFRKVGRGVYVLKPARGRPRKLAKAAAAEAGE